MKRLCIVFAAIMAALVIFLGGLPAQAQDDSTYFHDHTCYIALGPYIWDTEAGIGGGGWVMPPSAISSLDLRSIPEMSQRGGTPGYGLFFCKSSPGAGYYLLAADFNASILVSVTRLIENRWGIDVEAYTSNGTIWELFVEEGDPTGESRWKPLVPRHDGVLEILIQGFSPVEFTKDPPRGKDRRCGFWQWRWNSRGRFWQPFWMDWGRDKFKGRK